MTESHSVVRGVCPMIKLEAGNVLLKPSQRKQLMSWLRRSLRVEADRPIHAGRLRCDGPVASVRCGRRCMIPRGISFAAPGNTSGLPEYDARAGSPGALGQLRLRTSLTAGLSPKRFERLLPVKLPGRDPRQWLIGIGFEKGSSVASAGDITGLGVILVIGHIVPASLEIWFAVPQRPRIGQRRRRPLRQHCTQSNANIRSNSPLICA